MATSLYCSLVDVWAKLSQDGADARLDDDPSVYTDTLDEASRTIDEYCLHRYAESDLATSPIVQHWCASIAAFLLCERRGNPPPRGIAAKYERTLEKLERVQSGRRPGIADLVERRVQAPLVSNVRIKLDPFPRTVVERKRSSSHQQATDYPQHADRQEYFDYTI